MVNIVSIEDYFSDAPYYREHEAICGAAYCVKNPEDSYAAGLWFAKIPERIEIAKRVSVNTSMKIPTSREVARREYEFSIVDIKPGDAVINEYIEFEGSRDGHDHKSRDFHLFYETLYNNGALIRFHIPQDQFRAEYEFDDVWKTWRKKPFQIKFAPADSYVRMTDGSVEQIKRQSDVFLKNGTIVTKSPHMLSGIYERIICGQPLEFYMSTAQEMLGHNPNLLGPVPHALGLSLRIDFDRNRKLLPSSNPYHSMKALYMQARSLFEKPGFVLTERQRKEFDAHFHDVMCKYSYFHERMRF